MILALNEPLPEEQQQILCIPDVYTVKQVNCKGKVEKAGHGNC